MTNADKIVRIETRIKLLKSRGEIMNMRIIKKLERQKKALLAQA